MSQDLDKFLSFVMKVHSLPRGDEAFITCPFSKDARNLRRRFYRLREELKDYNRELADRIVFRVEGHRLIALVPVDWSQNLGVSNASSNPGGVPPRTRLDDSSGEQGL